VIASPAKDATNLKHYEKLTKNNIPIVFFDNVWESSSESAVLIDDYYGGYQATKHLIEQGCKSIAHITLPNNIKIYADRKRGYQDALLHAGLPYDENMVIACISDVEEGYKVAQKLFATSPHIDAVFSTSDYSALGLYQYCKEKNIKIPDNVKIVGFGNASFTPYIEPSMSSVDQVSQAVGREAATLLLSHLSDENKNPTKTILQPTLVIRKSSIL
jgi:LacI family transcriptional regulator